jgi:hypothetical protein
MQFEHTRWLCRDKNLVVSLSFPLEPGERSVFIIEQAPRLILWMGKVY